MDDRKLLGLVGMTMMAMADPLGIMPGPTLHAERRVAEYPHHKKEKRAKKRMGQKASRRANRR